MNKEPSEFFKPMRPIKYVSSNYYQHVEHHLEALQALSKLCDGSYYIIDFYKKSFHYVSPHPLFLCGYSQATVQKFGFDFYPLSVPPDDLELLFLLNEAGFAFFYALPVNRRNKATISYDFRLKHKDKPNPTMINHKLSSLALTGDGNLWMAICLVTMSTREVPGNVHIVMQDDNSRYKLNVEERKFEPCNHLLLTNREKEILKYIAAGYRTAWVAQILEISHSTVKNHKAKILNKLNTNTIAGAVFYASKQNLI